MATMFDDATQRIETARLSRQALTQTSAPGASLVVLAREGARAVSVPAHGALVIGRGADADVVVEDASLSRLHARFAHGASGLVVEDLGSTNGTRIGSESVTRRALAAGERAVLGDVTVLVLRTAASAGAARLVSHDALHAIAADEIARARLFSRALCVLLVRVSGGPSLALDAVLSSLRVMDRACVASARELFVLLPEADVDVAGEIANAITRAAPSVSVVVAAWPQAGVDVDAVVESARTVACADGQVARCDGRSIKVSALVAESAPMRALVQTATRAAAANVPVLLVGETGSGKEVVARFIHDKSGRTGPMIATNCGAIPLTLVESTLFGHEKGAFTGAVSSQAGVLEAASGGTVFLDEIGELPLSAQAALLRALETKKVTRVGSTKELDVDVRVVSATHRDLDEMSKTGAFRQDLLYRLNTMTLAVPPLRERRDEIAVLARGFLAALAGQSAATSFSADALEALTAHAWPGNVRELKNAVERAAVLANGAVIEVDDLPPAVAGPVRPSIPASSASSASSAASARSVSGAPSLGDQVDAYEHKLIVAALTATSGSVAEAAVMLQLPKRTLQHKMKLHGITRKATYG